MEYTVSRSGTTLVTVREGTDTTARDEARAQLAEALEERAAERLVDWSVADADVYEHPTAPFDPYTIAVEFAVTVRVDADDADEAKRAGATAIDDALEAAGLDALTYTTAPAASSA